MRPVNAFYLILTVLFAACTITQEEDALDLSDNSGQEMQRELNYIPPIDDAELVTNWISEILSSDHLESQFVKSQDTVRNIHNKQQLDTINYFNTDLSHIGIYVTQSKSLLLETNLYDTDVSLSNKIKIGVDKTLVFDILDRKFANDTLIIREPDGYGIYFELLFKDNQLARIHYAAMVD